MIFMMFIRFLCGYVCFNCKSGFCEEFINLCRKNKIKLTNISYDNGCISAAVMKKNLKDIINIAEKTSCEITFREYGLPFLIKKYKNRSGILIGSIAGILLTVYLSSAVWSIEVNGNRKYTDEQIIGLCENCGVKKGTSKRKIDKKAIQNRIVAENDDIIWFALNITGCKVYAEVCEKAEKPEMFADGSPCNIICGQDGELISLDVDSGLPAVIHGGAVTKGQLLISGVLNNLDGTVNYTHAKGCAKVRFSKILYSSVSENENIMSVKSVSNIKNIYFFGLKIPLGFHKKTSREFLQYEYLDIGKTVLPCGIITRRITELKPDNTKLDENRLLLLTCYRYFNKEIKENVNCEKESEKLSYTLENGICTVKGRYVLIKDCALEQYFYVNSE